MNAPLVKFISASRIPDMISVCDNMGIHGDWYIFGSVASGNPAPSDIDVLFLCDDIESVRNIYTVLQAFLLSAPIHLIVMSRNEEEELKFREVVTSIAISKSSFHD